MNNFDNSDTGEPIHRQQCHETRICSISMNGKTVLFDAASTDRWIQSDTTIEIADGPSRAESNHDGDRRTGEPKPHDTGHDTSPERGTDVEGDSA